MIAFDVVDVHDPISFVQPEQHEFSGLFENVLQHFSIAVDPEMVAVATRPLIEACTAAIDSIRFFNQTISDQCI